VAVASLVLWFGCASLAFAPVAAQTSTPETDIVWTCPVHAIVADKDPGRCPICRRDLILVNVTVTWICADRPGVEQPHAGKCPDGSAADPKYTQQPHANHTPRHGGLFFMAPDNWHHLEGTLDRDGTFRVYLYDDYTRPLPADQVRQIAGRVVTREQFDAAARTTTELASERLTPIGDGAYLEAHLAGVMPPAAMTAKLKFKPDSPEYRFDFTFQTFSEDKAAATTDAKLLEVPESAADVLKLFDERVRAIGDLVKQGAFAQVWVPAMQSKDLALALDVRARELPPRRRAAAQAAVERLVRSAWLLDEYGDTGNRSQVEAAYAAFSTAAGEVASLYALVAGSGGR
jgi:hypothetical protein